MAASLSSLLDENLKKDSSVPLKTPPEEEYEVLPQQIASKGAQLTQDLLRHGTRVTSRFAESFAGIPGDVVQLFDSLMNIGIHGLTETLAGEQKEKFRKEYAKQLPAGADPYKYREYLPTSSNLRKYITTPIIESLAGKGYLEPRGDVEQLGDEIAGDLGAFLFPFAGKIPFKKALKMAGYGNLAKLAAKQINIPYVGKIPEWGQEGIKLGTMLAVNIGGPKRFKEIADKLYGNARQSLSESATIEKSSMRSVFNDLKKLNKKGDLPQSWAKKMDYFEELSRKRKIPVLDIWDLSKDINNAFYNEKIPAGFSRMFPQLKEGINSALKTYGKVNPQFYNNLTEANEIFSTLQKGNMVTRSLERMITPDKIGLATAGLLLGKYSPISLITSIGGAMMGHGILKTINILNKSPVARKYYYKTILNAVKNNPRQTNIFAQKLDKELTKETGPSWEDTYEVVPGGAQPSWEDIYEIVPGK